MPLTASPFRFREEEVPPQTFLNEPGHDASIFRGRFYFYHGMAISMDKPACKYAPYLLGFASGSFMRL